MLNLRPMTSQRAPLPLLPRFTTFERWSTSINDKQDDFNSHITHFPFLNNNIPSSSIYVVFSLNLYDTPVLAFRMIFLFWGQGDSPVSYSIRETSWNTWNLIQEVLWSIRGSYSAIWSLLLTHVKWKWLPNRSDFPPISWNWYLHQITSGSMEHLKRVWHASRERLPFRKPGSILVLAYAEIVDTSFPELALSFLDFSPWICHGTFSILLLQFTKLYIHY